MSSTPTALLAATAIVSAKVTPRARRDVRVNETRMPTYSAAPRYPSGIPNGLAKGASATASQPCPNAGHSSRSICRVWYAPT
ncbi:MAG: hypothetical protein Q8L14_21110 [Myxococcales bacterium]|nr:hypothetical protein [Myxococcales bacterium]